MKTRLHVRLIVCVAFLASCNNQENAGSASSSDSDSFEGVYSAENINNLVIEARIKGIVNLPEQRFGQRVQYLNEKLKELGFDQGVTVTAVSDLMNAPNICYGYSLKDPKFSALLAVSMERYKLMYGVSDGEIRYMKMTLENLRAYPTIERPDPFE